MNKKTILFGFEPFLNDKSNITKDILINLNQLGIKKIIFPVEYSRNKIISQIFEDNQGPDYIVGLGQHYSGNLFRIERNAQKIFWEKINIKNKDYFATGMIQENPSHYELNLKLPKKNFSWVSYDAGFYVCNYFMYVIMDYIVKKKLKTKFAFIHIPPKYNPIKAKKELNEYLNILK